MLIWIKALSNPIDYIETTIRRPVYFGEEVKVPAPLHQHARVPASLSPMRHRIVLCATGLALLTGGVAQAAATGAGACADYKPGQAAATRLQGVNRQRLAAAEALVAPGFASRQAVSGLAILADYQEEMEKVHPDRNVAAQYLATAATIPVTLDLLTAVNRTLCVAASAATARAVATAAETARVEMAR
ncbi:MAG: hypothetical protein KGJ41_05555 [Rhodospirillales bacterium]|nr:hypothetical protein [Rhodospirillales bacterium]MDE2574309.1 hypothetical protein [Rhodospirillales bacterium]